MDDTVTYDVEYLERQSLCCSVCHDEGIRAGNEYVETQEAL